MLLLFAIACASFSAFAQNDLCENNLLINGDFNSSTCDGIGTSCVPNWYIGGWSPTIFDLSSNPYAWMWSYGGIGEAIYANFNFVMGVTYDISFSVRTDDQNTNCPNVADNATTINLIATNSPGTKTKQLGIAIGNCARTKINLALRTLSGSHLSKEKSMILRHRESTWLRSQPTLRNFQHGASKIVIRSMQNIAACTWPSATQASSPSIRAPNISFEADGYAAAQFQR